MSTAIVTGATGFLGSHLARRLRLDDWDVIALKRSLSQIPKHLADDPKIRWFDVDTATGISDAFDATNTIDAVVHLAASYGRKEDPPTSIVQSNLIFPLEILQRSLQRDVPLFINTDTCFTIEYPYLQSYTLSKKQFSEWGRILAATSGMRFVNLELQHPFGPGDRSGKFVPWIIQQCHQDCVPIPLTPGEQKKDFIYVDDVVMAFLTIMARFDKLDKGYHHIECGRGESISLRRFVELVHEASQSNCPLEFGKMPYRPMEIMNSVADTHRLRELGWKSICSIEDGISATVSEYRKDTLRSSNLKRT